MEKIYHENINRWKAEVYMHISLYAILISDKVHFRANKITRDKEGYDILIKGLIHKEVLQS